MCQLPLECLPLLLGPLSWQGKEIHVYIPTCVYTHMSIIILYVISYTCKSYTWIHTDISISSPLSQSSYSSVTSHSTSENPGPHCFASIYLIVLFQYGGFRTAKPYPMGKTLSARVQSLCIIPFALSLNNHSFPKLFRLASYSSTFFNEVVSYIHNAFRFFCHILHFILGSQIS